MKQQCKNVSISTFVTYKNIRKGAVKKATERMFFIYKNEQIFFMRKCVLNTEVLITFYFNFSFNLEFPLNK